MARSNGPPAGAGQRPPQSHLQQSPPLRSLAEHVAAPSRFPAPHDPYAAEPAPYQHPQVGGYDDPYAQHQAPGGAPDPYAAQDPRYANYGHAQPDPYYAPPREAPYEAPPFGRAPPPDPYARHEPTFANPGPVQHPHHADPSPFQHAPDLRGPLHDQWGQPAQPGTGGYDMGGYEAVAPPAGYQPPLQARYPAHEAPAWGADDPYAAEHADLQTPQPAGYDGEFAGYQMAEPEGGALATQYGEDDGEEAYEDVEPRRRSRFTLIAAALVGAIGIGGGLAFGYKTLMGHGPGGTPPLVKSEASPSKMRPAEPGGKQFAHTDSKIMGRLSDTGSVAAASATASDAEGGTRKVQTLVVGRDGSIEAGAAAPITVKSSPSAAAPVVSVPGMTVIDGFGATPAGASRPATQRPVVVNPPPAAAPAPPEKPAVIARAAPVEAPAPASKEPEAKPVASKPAPPPAAERKPVPKKVAAATPTTSAPSASRAGGSGYVAVLASVPASSSSRMEALKQFADMQQKYSGVLQSKIPDVTEANLGAKGTYHRLVIGPPASREQASALCSQLKSAGYSGCWVTAY